MENVLNKVFEISLKELMGFQINAHGYFRRLDIVIKHMALNDVLHNDGVGLVFYRKMYNKLCRTSRGKVEGHISNLRTLSKKIETNAFDTKTHPILLTPRKSIWDGTHRVVCACYYGCPSIFVKNIRREFKKGNDFGLNRIKRVFDKSEIEIILNEQNKIFDKLKLNIGD